MLSSNKPQSLIILAIMFCFCGCQDIKAKVENFKVYNNESMTVNPVRIFIPSSKTKTWDLSRQDLIGEQYEISVSWRDDSVFSAYLPGKRYDFKVVGDTIFRTATETHFIRLNDTIPMPMFVSTLTDSVIIKDFASRGRAFHSEYINSKGSMRLSTCEMGQLILPEGDTINSVYLTQHQSFQYFTSSLQQQPDINHITDSCQTTLERTTQTYLWRSADYMFPLAATFVVSDSVGNEENGDIIAKTWICPPSNQPVPSMALAKNFPKLKIEDRFFDNKASDNTKQAFDTNINIIENYIQFNGICPVNGIYSIVLCDVAGRVLYSDAGKYYREGDEISWTTDRLSDGQYILYVNKEGETLAAQKIIVK